MLGAIIGDIVGSRFEFNNTKNYNFELFTPECSFTDDTICTIAIADALTDGCRDYKKSLLYWCNLYKQKGVFSRSFSNWFMSDNPQPYNSFGNGSAMRVSPVAWWFDNLERVKIEAIRTAGPTHNHPEGVKGAVAVAHAIFYLRNGGNKDGLIELANEYYPGFLHYKYSVGKFDATSQGTVPLCFYIIVHSTSFENAIRNAIVWGGDSDTIGAIVGSMAEALWDIPEEMYEKSLGCLPERMRIIVEKIIN